MEIWKPTSFEGYEVSNFGNVRSVDRVITDKNGVKYRRKGKMLSQNLDHKGYKRVQIKNKWVPVHRLVAEAFIPNPENKPQVNHKDCNKHNNHVDNLEWVTNAENHKHKMENGMHINSVKGLRRYTRSIQKRVAQYTLDGEFVAKYESINEAARSVNTYAIIISEVCRGKRKSCKGFLWKFV